MMTWIYGDELITRGHLLVAGAAGSGKSVLLNDLIASILTEDPNKHRMVLVDPKLTEFEPYRHCAHTFTVANETAEIEVALNALIKMMDARNAISRDRGTRFYLPEWGPRIHLIIDEFADMMLENEARKRLRPKLQRLAQKGRAANIQLIAATQCPLARVIPTEVKVNFEIAIGLRTLSAAHSRNILDVAGCEKLPKYGKCLVHDPDELTIVEKTIPFIPESELFELARRMTPTSTEVV